MVDAKCIQLREEYLVLFHETCGGNGCPEQIYGVYNLNHKKLLLNPRDWLQDNLKEAEKILGSSLDNFKESNYFCCTKENRKLIRSYLSEWKIQP